MATAGAERCPRCDSPNVLRDSGSFLTRFILEPRTSYCRKCGHEWPWPSSRLRRRLHLVIVPSIGYTLALGVLVFGWFVMFTEPGIMAIAKGAAFSLVAAAISRWTSRVCDAWKKVPQIDQTHDPLIVEDFEG